MKQFILLLALALSVNVVLGRAVSGKKEKIEQEKQHEPQDTEDVADALEYERYLKEVVNALETDPDFRKKLDNASDVDIRSGKIANELEHVSHHVRTKLDEIKRREIERLRLAAIKHYELTNDLDRKHLKIDHKHIDHENPHTFEEEDLKKLIQKTSEDLAEADRKRRQEFKEYEMQKEFEKQEKLKALSEEERKKYEEDLKLQQQKHNKHEPLHHPGNKAQLEEVWEKQDHMDAADFDPKTFFMMHDLDGNNFWDETEVKALFVRELDKVYQSGMPEDDMRERIEEMERMREHVFREADTNHDNLISFDEFIAQTKREEFNRDPNWETVDNQPQFTHEEYLEFERRRQEEIQRLIAQGVLPPHPNMPQGYYPNQHQQQQQQQHQQQQPPQYHYQGNYPGGQPVQLNQNQVYQHVDPAAHHNLNQGQVHPNQAYQQPNVQHPGQQMHPGQLSQGQVHPNPNQINAQYQAGNAQYQAGNAQYQPIPNQNINNPNIPNQNINNPNVNVNTAGQSGNQQQQQQQFQQPNINAVPAANAQNTGNVPIQNNAQYQQPKLPDSNLNQINANVKVDTKH